MSDIDDDYYDDGLPASMAQCDRCNGDGDIEDGDDVISEYVLCPVCYGKGVITLARYDARQKMQREMQEALHAALKAAQ